METQSLKDCVVNVGHFFPLSIPDVYNLKPRSRDFRLPPDDAVTRHVCRRAEKARLAEIFFGRPGPGLAEFFFRRRD